MDNNRNDSAGAGNQTPDGKHPKNRFVFTLIIAIAIVITGLGIFEYRLMQH